MMFIIKEVIVYNNNKKGGVNLGDLHHSQHILFSVWPIN